MIAVYSVGFAWMKYKEGYTKVLGFGCTQHSGFKVGSRLTICNADIPTPYVFWPQAYQDSIFPLMLVFSFAWSLEMYAASLLSLRSQPEFFPKGSRISKVRSYSSSKAV